MEDGLEELVSELRAEQWENQESSRGRRCKETQRGEELSESKVGRHLLGSCNQKEGSTAGSRGNAK